MQHAHQFFEGLTGPASLTFLGLLFAAFLIGVLPAGLAYATRVRKLKRGLSAARETLAHTRTQLSEARDEAATQTEALSREREGAAVLQERIRLQNTEHQRHLRELQQERQEAEALRGSRLAAQIEAKENAELVQSLRGRVDALTAQVQGLKQANSARPAPAGAFDVNMAASLRAARTKVEGLERRLDEVTADNERLRSRLLAS